MSAERISRSRSKVSHERALLAKLEEKIAVEEMKQVLLGPAWLRLDQVDGFYLDQKRLDEPRSEAAWSRWLDGAEREFASAVKCRGQPEETIRKAWP